MDKVRSLSHHDVLLLDARSLASAKAHALSNWAGVGSSHTHLCVLLELSVSQGGRSTVTLFMEGRLLGSYQLLHGI